MGPEIPGSSLSSLGPLYWYPGICRLIKLLEIKSAIINYHSNVRLGAQIEFHVNFSSAEEEVQHDGIYYYYS